MSYIEDTHCCGMDVFEGVTTDTSAMASLEYIARHYVSGWTEACNVNPVPNIVFADVRGKFVKSIMRDIIRVIQGNKLGKVTISPWKLNHGNYVRSVIWSVDKVKFRAWAMRTFPEVKALVKHRRSGGGF